MSIFLNLLAQGPPAQPQQTPGWLLWAPLIFMGVIFYFMIFRPQGSEKKRRAQMLAGLKKNDRVVTIGGILGTVVTVKDDEVTLKVDESNNTKLTFQRGAIQRVISREQRDSSAAEAGAPAKPSEPAGKR